METKIMLRLEYLPYGYFIKTRVDSKKSFFFQVVYEWAPWLLLASIGEYQIETIALCFCVFACFYEIGYIFNDLDAFFSNKKDERIRYNFTNIKRFVMLVNMRLIFALIILSYLDIQCVFQYSIFLVTVYLVHNVVETLVLKPFTFVLLATARFLAPFIGELPYIDWSVWCALSFYLVYRSFNYLVSKRVLEKSKGSFNWVIFGNVIVLFTWIIQGHLSNVLVWSTFIYFSCVVGVIAFRHKAE